MITAMEKQKISKMAEEFFGKPMCYELFLTVMIHAMELYDNGVNCEEIMSEE